MNTAHLPVSIRDHLLQVRTIRAHWLLPKCGATLVLLICPDGTTFEATSDMASLGERIEVGCIRLVPFTRSELDPADFVLLGHIAEPTEFGLLEIEVMNQRLVSGVFFRSAAGEAGIVASAAPVHLTWYGTGLSEPDGASEYDLSAYRRAVL